MWRAAPMAPAALPCDSRTAAASTSNTNVIRAMSARYDGSQGIESDSPDRPAALIARNPLPFQARERNMGAWLAWSGYIYSQRHRWPAVPAQRPPAVDARGRQQAAAHRRAEAAAQAHAARRSWPNPVWGTGACTRSASILEGKVAAVKVVRPASARTPSRPAAREGSGSALDGHREGLALPPPPGGRTGHSPSATSPSWSWICRTGPAGPPGVVPREAGSLLRLSDITEAAAPADLASST